MTDDDDNDALTWLVFSKKQLFYSRLFQNLISYKH